MLTTCFFLPLPIPIFFWTIIDLASWIDLAPLVLNTIVCNLLSKNCFKVNPKT